MKRKHLRSKCVVGITVSTLLGLLSIGFLMSQARDTASVFGVVTDSTGGVIPGATVTLTNINTAVERTALTGDTGGYAFSSVPVGTYRLTVEQAGFRRYEHVDLLLQANDNVKVDIVLQLGELASTVTVSGAASLVDLRSATLNQTIDSRQVVELPLEGRNPADLALLSPGVLPAGSDNLGDTGFQQGVIGPKGGKIFSVNGSRQNDIRYTLDGGSHTEALHNLNLPFPFPDAVQEFSVQTSNMEPEIGINSAGAINVVTKSGTNRFHGNVFWFVRNTALNATNFFSHEEDQLKRNQAGFTFGGPIKRDKLFFFGGFQKLTLRSTPGDTRALTLTAAERQGDFSGQSIPIVDPLTGEPFPNNQIPSSRLSPAAQSLLTFSPLPDPDGFTRFAFNQPEDHEQYILRFDYAHSQNHNFMVRLLRDDQETPFQSPPRNLHAFGRTVINDSKAIVIGHNYVTSTLVIDTRASANHVYNHGASDFEGTIRDFGVDLTPLSNDISISLSNSGVSFSVPMQIHFARANEEIAHDWAWTRGNHVLKWGTSINWKQYNEDTRFRSSGFFRFDGSVTGFDRADFMLGEFSFFTQNNGELENRRQTLTGFYFNDTWRVSRNFTLNLGIRYEPYTFFTDTMDRAQTFHLPNYLAGIRTAKFNNAPPGLLYRGDAKPWGDGLIGKAVAEPDLNNIAPRVGFAWDIFGDGRTSLRGGYAIFYDTPALLTLNDANNVAPFSFSVEFQSGLLDAPYRGREHLNLFPVEEFGSEAPYADPLFTVVLDNKWILPYIQNWSLTLERQITAQDVVRVGYVGTKGTHLPTGYDQNPPIYNPDLTLAENIATVDERRPIKGYQSIVRWMHGLNSTYHGLQASHTRRYATGFSLSNSYTWSKALDYESFDGFSTRTIPNPFNFFARRGPSDWDRKHRFVSSFVWDLPKFSGDEPAAIKVIANDWRATGIVTLQSGRPFTIGATGDPTAGGGRAYADLVGTGNPVLDTGRSKGEKIARYFDTSRFQNPAPNSFGTLGRNALTGPGYANVDLSLVKEAPLSFLGESGRLETRFEAFNLFNATHLGLPVTGLTNPNFGSIVSTAGEQRIIQLALKVFF